MAKTILSSAALLLLFSGAKPALAADPAAQATGSPAASSSGPAPTSAQPPTTSTPDKPAPDKPASDKPASDKPASDKPAPDRPPPDKPASDKPGATESAVAVWENAPSLRRAGFSMGLHLAGGFGNVSGFPADIKKRTDAFRADTGVALGGSATLWLGGALSDWLVFGVGLGGGRSQGNGTVVQGITFVFHTEVFPLFWLGGVFHDLGVGLDTGAGSFTGELENKPAGDAGKLIAPVIESGAASRVGASIFYDGLRFSKFSTGPYVAFDYTWSATLNQPLLLVGLRTALYTKAPKKK